MRPFGQGVWRDVSCRVEQGVVILFGRVSTFYQKQIAQERLRQCLGASIPIRNDLSVRGSS